MSKQGKTPSTNDQRSNVKNPNNPAFKSDRDNRSNQLNPNSPSHPNQSSGGSVPGSSSNGSDSGNNPRR
jgi:hypothetical protein